MTLQHVMYDFAEVYRISITTYEVCNLRLMISRSQIRKFTNLFNYGEARIENNLCMTSIHNISSFLRIDNNVHIEDERYKINGIL